MKFRYRRHRSTISPETDMTPMIDMCFQLIAFFTIALNFASAEQDQSVRVPASELARPPDDTADPVVTLQMRSGGEILFGGNSYTLGEIGPALERQVRVMERLGQRSIDKTVVIRADRAALAGQVQQLIQKCQRAGFEKFSLKARQEKS